jgi:hypothetical protein
VLALLLRHIIWTALLHKLAPCLCEEYVVGPWLSNPTAKVKMSGTMMTSFTREEPRSVLNLFLIGTGQRGQEYRWHASHRLFPRPSSRRALPPYTEMAPPPRDKRKLSTRTNPTPSFEASTDVESKGELRVFWSHVQNFMNADTS